MPSQRLFGVVGEITRFQGKGDPLGEVREIARMEGLDRIESLGHVAVPATQEKDQSIDWGAQAGGDVLDWRGDIEAMGALDARSLSDIDPRTPLPGASDSCIRTIH